MVVVVVVVVVMMMLLLSAVLPALPLLTACRSYNSFDEAHEACARNDRVFEDMGPAIAASIKSEHNVRLSSSSSSSV